MGVPTPQFSASATGRALMYQGNETVAVDAATARAAVYAAPFDALAYNGMQLNGAMDVSQENGTTARTTSGYVVDGWTIDSSGVQTFSAAQVADAPAGLSKSLKVTITGANATPGASDYIVIYQSIEGYRTARLSFGTASAQSVSIGFWSKIHRTGPYSGSIRNSGASRSYPFSFTQNVADTWEFKTVTVPGDVTGTWVGATSGTGMQVMFSMAGGASVVGAADTWAATYYHGVTGTTNGMAATTDTFQITGVIVLPGIELPISTQAALIMRPYDQELRTCKRYYQKIFNPPGAAIGDGTNATLYFWSFNLPVEMRAAPSASLSSNIQFTTPSAAYSGTGVSANNSNVTSWNVNLTSSAVAPATTLVTQSNVSNAAIADARL